ncbi:MAG: pseudouridine synthase [Gammaproteobacteria bacterium]|nr:pseudouridine synthase [Gammaproteobacteria bacterium]
MSQILLFNKPFGVLSQFTGGDKSQTLAAYITQPGFYAAGRLDKDSEGLLLLTNDGKLQQFIANPEFKQGKTYLAQVEGDIDDVAINRLQQGVLLNDGPTKRAQAARISAPQLWERVPPIRQRKLIPTSWLELTLFEGRNRQVRRMTAAVGFPTLRLIRLRIGDWDIGDLQPGETRMLDVAGA